MTEATDWYRAVYLASEHWRHTSHQARRRAGYRCQDCKRITARLGVFHLSYERLGQETPADLAKLCETCHTRAPTPPPEGHGNTIDAARQALADDVAAGRRHGRTLRPMPTPDELIALQWRAAQKRANQPLTPSEEKLRDYVLANWRLIPMMVRTRMAARHPAIAERLGMVVAGKPDHPNSLRAKMRRASQEPGNPANLSGGQPPRRRSRPTSD